MMYFEQLRNMRTSKDLSIVRKTDITHEVLLLLVFPKLCFIGWNGWMSDFSVFLISNVYEQSKPYLRTFSIYVRVLKSEIFRMHTLMRY